MKAMVPEPTDGFWLPLDNAAKIWPAVIGKEQTSVFRISVELKQRVRIKALLEAVRSMEDRFPYFKMRLKAGFFWYYLEYLDLPIAVVPDLGESCRGFAPNGLMFRVLVRENFVSIEFSHILTDGGGGLEFLKTLLITYFENCGIPVPPGISYCRPGEEPSKEEYEDSYLKYFEKIKGSPIKGPRAFHIPFRLGPMPRFDRLTAIVSLEELTKKAKESDVSITEFLVAVYLHSYQEIFLQLSAYAKRKSHKIIKIEVPVNLRRILPSATMRNFSLFVKPGIDLRLGIYTFEEIVKVVYHQMRLQSDIKLLNKTISRHVSGEKNPVVRGMPLFLKSFLLSRIYMADSKSFSSVISNYGRISFPPGISDQIEKFVFIPPPPNKITKINCGVIGFENKLIISFGNISVSKELERHFLTFLTASGIPVKMIKQ